MNCYSLGQAECNVCIFTEQKPCPVFKWASLLCFINTSFPLSPVILTNDRPHPWASFALKTQQLCVGQIQLWLKLHDSNDTATSFTPGLSAAVIVWR